MPEKFKLSVYISYEFKKELSAWADRLEISDSQFATLCIKSGMQALIQAVSPRSSLTPEAMAAVIRAAQKQGVEIDFNDFRREIDEYDEDTEENDVAKSTGLGDHRPD